MLGDSILKHVNGYEITKKLNNCIREEFFWSRNKIYGGLCLTHYQDQSRPCSGLIHLYHDDDDPMFLCDIATSLCHGP